MSKEARILALLPVPETTKEKARQAFIERRKIPRPKKGSTMRRILDITFTQIRKTEAKKNEQTRKGD